MKLTLSFNAVAVFTIAIMLGAVGVSAQGRYVGQYSKADVDDIIKRLEDSSDEFRTDFRRELDNTNLSNSQKNGYRQQVDKFENAADRLRSKFDEKDKWWESRSQVRKLVEDARPLNVTMNSISFRRTIERQWGQLRNNINTLADTFDLPGIDGGGWNRGDGSGNGRGRGNPPTWAQGTWYWTQGYGRTMTINSDGSIMLMNEGRTSQGTYNKNGQTDTIFIDGIRSTISQNGNNIRTYNSVTGEHSEYSRSNRGIDHGDRGGKGGWGNRPPTWAQGTWYWTQGYGRTMTINSDGSIMLMNEGRTSQGTYNKNGQTDTIFIDGIRSTISQNGNNIKTYNSATGEYSEYSRNNSGNSGGMGSGNGTMTRPPTWARGTWYWVEGANRRMVIENDGRITLYNQGRTSYGTYSNNIITIEGTASTISRQGNQIKTVNQSTGEYSTYRR